MSTIQSRNVFYGINSADSSDSILLEAASELGAKIELLDQLGYAIEQSGNTFVIYDVESVDNTSSTVVGATSMESALDIALKISKWHVSEPVEMIGGHVPGGMGYDDEQRGW